MFNPALGSQTSQTVPGVGPAQGLLGGALGGLGIYNSGRQAGLWGAPSGGGTGTLGNSTVMTPIGAAPGQLGSGTFGLFGG